MGNDNLKVCTGICKQSKPFSEFNKNKCKPDGYNTICRLCSNEHSQAYYTVNKSRMIKQIYKTRKIRSQINRQFVYNYLHEHGCTDCSENDPKVLEFDHFRDKENNVAHMLRGSFSLKRIKAEIAKCAVRCANCHRRKTAIEQNWYADLETIDSGS